MTGPLRFLSAFARATTLPVRFEWSAPLLFVFAIVFAVDDLGSSDRWSVARSIGITMLALAVALFAHEWSHAAAAMLAGGTPGTLHVHGFGAAVPVAGVPDHRKGAVYAAGPVMNLSIAAVAGALAAFGDLALLDRLASLNFLLGVLNLLPIGGTDGEALRRLGPKARVARGSSWTMVVLLALVVVTSWLAAFATVSAAGHVLGLATAAFGVVGALLVGWHGVLDALRERNEWGDITDVVG